MSWNKRNNLISMSIPIPVSA